MQPGEDMLVLNGLVILAAPRSDVFRPLAANCPTPNEIAITDPPRSVRLRTKPRRIPSAPGRKVVVLEILGCRFDNPRAVTSNNRGHSLGKYRGGGNVGRHCSSARFRS